MEQARLLQVLRNIAKEYGYDENNILLKPISSGGANYTSKLFTITLTSRGKDLKLFSKVAVLGETARSMSDLQIYEIEIIFYTSILTRFRELEARYNIPDTDRLFLPKYYGGVTEYAEELMVLEDLTALGFQSFNRHKCFDWNYASTCVKSLANFHALSVAYEREHPVEFETIVGKLKFNASKDSMRVFLNKGIQPAIDATDEVYRTKVELFLRNDMRKETFVKYFNSERKVVLVHGDFRPSNILHKIDNYGKLQIALVDYQIIKRGNPVTDLLYFLICGSDERFRAENLQRYFNYYYETFKHSLQRLGIDSETVYKEQDYRDDVKEMLPFGLTLATLVLLFVTVDEDEAPRPEDGIDFSSIEIKASDQFRVRFNALVRDYVALGIL